MSQYRNLASGGFALFLAASQVGCAGGGLKNIFTRNETDGYHSIDELEAEERRLADAEESAEDESPSIAARTASWRSFSKPAATETAEEADSAYDSAPTAADSEEKVKPSNAFSRAFAKRDSVDPDPFLETESARTKRITEPALTAAPNRELAGLDEKSAAAKKNDKPAADENEFTMTTEPKAKSGKDAKVAATKARAESESSDAEDSDALARRFEQHFLLNSAGIVARADAEDRVAGSAETIQKKAVTIAASADSKQRNVSSLAEKQIDSFDYLLANDSSNETKLSSSKGKSAAEPLTAARFRNVVDETAANSLAAFDSLVGIETNNLRNSVIEAAHTVTRGTQDKSAAVEINVADPDALFGAAAARQNSREKRTATAATAKTSNNGVTGNEFDWSESHGPEGGVESRVVQAETSGRSGSRPRSNASEDLELFHTTTFAAPPATAGNIEDDDCSVVETADSQPSGKTAFASRTRDVTTRSGRNQSKAAILPAAVEASQHADVHFTAAPVAPVPELESTDRVAPAASRPGLIQSLSVRNWMLLLGGLVVIVLLFAPARTKPATMTGRTANG